MKIVNIIFSISLMALLIISCATHPRDNYTPMTLSAPQTVESGRMIPIAVDIPSNMSVDNTLIIEVDGETAAIYSLTDAFIINKISLNVRMTQSSDIRAILTKQGEPIDTVSQHIEVQQGHSIPDSGNASLSRKIRIGKHIIQVVFDNAMASQNYISQVIIETNLGNVRIETTTQLAANPYFSIQALSNIEKVYIKAQTNHQKSWAMLSSSATQ